MSSTVAPASTPSANYLVALLLLPCLLNAAHGAPTQSTVSATQNEFSEETNFPAFTSSSMEEEDRSSFDEGKGDVVSTSETSEEKLEASTYLNTVSKEDLPFRTEQITVSQPVDDTEYPINPSLGQSSTEDRSNISSSIDPATMEPSEVSSSSDDTIPTETPRLPSAQSTEDIEMSETKNVAETAPDPPNITVTPHQSQLFLFSPKPPAPTQNYLSGIQILLLFCALSVLLLVAMLLLIGALHCRRVRQRRILWQDHEDLGEDYRSGGGGLVQFRRQKSDADGYPIMKQFAHLPYIDD